MEAANGMEEADWEQSARSSSEVSEGSSGSTNPHCDPEVEERSEAMVLARALCDRINSVGDSPTDETLVSLRQDLQQLHLLVQAEARQSAEERARFLVEKDVMREEMHAEHVDREANAARVAERQRFLFERSVAQPGQASAAERASASASFVEAALASLCPHVAQKSPGMAQLAEA
jgi:hypothetical protein